MKRIVVFLSAEFAVSFTETAGVSFKDALTGILTNAFGEGTVKCIKEDEYNLEIEVDEGENDISSSVLRGYIIENLSLKDIIGQALTISVFSVKHEENAFVQKEKKQRFVDHIHQYAVLKNFLSEHTRGQQHAINTLVNGFVRADTFIEDKPAPHLSFFFAGEEGSGKEFLASTALTFLAIPYVKFGALDYLTGRVFPVLCDFVNRHPNGAVIFNEAEEFTKEMVGAIYSAFALGMINNVSVKGLTMFFITKCGRSLYENSRANLSHLSSEDIAEACLKDLNPLTREPYFNPIILEKITSENVVMFNHLNMADYQAIIASALQNYAEKVSMRLSVGFDVKPYDTARLVMYQNPDVRNINKLIQAAYDLVNKEVEHLLLQNKKDNSDYLLANTSFVRFEYNMENAPEDVLSLFSTHDYSIAVATKDEDIIAGLSDKGYVVYFVESVDDMRECIRKLHIDAVLIDPTLGLREREKYVDIEDYDSVGMDIFNYVKHYHGALPLELISNINDQRTREAFQTLIEKGADGLLYYSDDDISLIADELQVLMIGFELEKDIKYLKRNNLHLEYNSRQEEYGPIIHITFAKFALRQVGIKFFDRMNDDPIRIRGFDDIFGCQAAKDSLKGYSTYLTNTAQYLESGALPPKLILLCTPAIPRYGYFVSGIGKTALVKALVAETGAELIKIDGKEVIINQQNPFDAIHDAFKKARYSAPAVIYFNNISTLIQAKEDVDMIRLCEALSSEINYCSMDTAHPVIVIGECDPLYQLNNRLVEMCTRKFVLPLPTIEHNEQFIKRYFEEKHIDTVSIKGIKNLAKRTVGFQSFKEVARLIDFIINYAQNRPVTDQILKECYDIRIYGDISNTDLTGETLLTVSYHEVGHYMLMRLFGEHSPFVTVVPRSTYGGYTAIETKDGLKLRTKQDMLNRICVSFGGRAGEILLHGEEIGTTCGISGDIISATDDARDMVIAYAMGDHLAAYSEEEVLYNSPEIYANVNKILDEQFARSKRLLELNKEGMKVLAEALSKAKAMTGDELEELWPDDKLIHE